MAKKANYRVQLRRRREGKTDYQARKALVTSRKPRLVTRGSNKNVEVQIIVAKPHGDVVLAAANSRELIKNYSWMAPTGNIPAAYLTGFLCGLKAKKADIQEAILDIGLVSPTKGSRTFAVLSGVVDAGVEVPHSEDKIVKERTKGEHIAKYAKNLGTGSEQYAAKFSQYNAKGVFPEKISEHFSKVKANIIAVSKGEKLPEEAAEPKATAPTKTKAPQAAVETPLKEEAPAMIKEEKPVEVSRGRQKAAAKAPKAKATKEKAQKKRATVKETAPKEKAVKEKAPKATTKAAQPKAPKTKEPKAKAAKKGEKKE